MTLFDIHTHKVKKEKNVASIISAQWNNDDNFYSIGIHPWHIKDNYIEELKLLDSIAVNSNVLAIGEIGLDKVYKIKFELQKELLLEQLALAEKHRKPVIIHCVKAFDEILSMTRTIKVPLIMHGFNKGCEIAKQFLDREFYLSFGKSIFDRTSKSVEALKETPLSQLFLETDESDLPILEIYKHASEIKDIGIDLLTRNIEQNFRRVFRTNGV